MSSPTINEVRQKKEELESKIKGLVKDFEIETGIAVDVIFQYDFGDKKDIEGTEVGNS